MSLLTSNESPVGRASKISPVSFDRSTDLLKSWAPNLETFVHFPRHRGGGTSTEHHHLATVCSDKRLSEETPGDQMRETTTYPSQTEAKIDKVTFASTRLRGDWMREVLEPWPAGTRVPVSSTIGWV